MVYRVITSSLLAVVVLLSGRVLAATPVELKPGVDNTETRLVLYTNRGVVEQTVSVRLPGGQTQVSLRPDYQSWQMDSLQLWTAGESGNRYADSISWLHPPDSREQLIAGMLGSEVEVRRAGGDALSKGRLIYWRNNTGILQWASGRQEVFSVDGDVMIRSLDHGPLAGQRLASSLIARFSLDKPANAVSLSYINQSLGYQTWYQLITNPDDVDMTLIHDALLANNSDSDYRQVAIQLASGDTGTVPQVMAARRSHVARMAAKTGNQSQRRRDLSFTVVPGHHDLLSRSRKKIRLSVMGAMKGGHHYQYRFHGQAQPGNRPVQGHPVPVVQFVAPTDLPAGRVRVFEEDSDGRLFITGESWLAQSAAGSQVSLGQKEAAYTVDIEQSKLDVRQQVNQLIVSWRLLIRNRKKDMVQLRIMDEDHDLLRIDQLKGVKLADDGALVVDLSADSEKTVFFSTVYRRKQ